MVKVWVQQWLTWAETFCWLQMRGQNRQPEFPLQQQAEVCIGKPVSGVRSAKRMEGHAGKWTE